MGFLDKVKATAQTVAEKAQEGVKTGQEKIQDAREKRSLDATLRDLGAAVFLDRTGRGTPQLTAEIERLMAEMRDLEAGGAVVQPPAAPAAEPVAETEAAPADAPAPSNPPPAPPTAPQAPSGDFNLDDV